MACKLLFIVSILKKNYMCLSVLFFVLGCSDDWAKGKGGIKYSYTIELPDKGVYGFLLPAEKIVPTGREVFTGVKSIVKSILKINSMKEKTKSVE